MRAAMYKATGAPPVVGGLVRSSMGTSLARVAYVIPFNGNSWVCGTRYLGKVVNGAWVPPGLGPHQPTRWAAVGLQPRAGWHAVTAHNPPAGGPQ